MRVGVVYVYHREGQPAPASRGVVQKFRLVGRTAETRDVRPVLLIVPVGPPLVYRRQRHHRLELVDVLQTHLVDFLQANQSKLRKRQVVVLRHPPAVGTHRKIPLQLRREQTRQPGRLVTALPPHKHQNFMIRHLLHHQRGHRGHQPLAETRVEQGRIALHLHRGRQPPDVVGHPIPFRQRTEILCKGIEFRHKLRLQHRAHVAQPHCMPLLGHSAPERVHHTVGQVDKLVGIGMPYLLFSGDDIFPELRLRRKKVLNHIGRSQAHTSICRASVSRTAQLGRPLSVRFRIGITRAENGSHIPVVFRKTSVCPADGLLQRQTEFVHQIAHAHDIVVVMVRGIHHPLPVQFLADAGHHPLYTPHTRGSRFRQPFRIKTERLGIRPENTFSSCASPLSRVAFLQAGSKLHPVSCP